MIWAERIKILRLEHNLTQKDVTAVLGTSLNSYGAYERGKRKLPVKHLVKLCSFYNITPDYILGLIDEMKPLPEK